MSKAIERRMTLKDQVTPAMSKINKSTVTYKTKLKNLRKQGNKTWKDLKTGVKVASAAIVGAVYALNKTQEGYEDQMAAEVKLQAVMTSTGKATATNIQGLKDYASAMQGAGVIGDEVTLSAMQQLATFNVTSNTIETLTEGMLDLAAQQNGLNSTQENMITIGNMVGKAMNGQASAMSRVGIIFSDAQSAVLEFGTEEEKAATMAEVLQQNVGGVNAALLATDAGKIKQAENAIGDLGEQTGSVVAKIKAGFASAFMDYLPQIQSSIERVTTSINGWVDNGGIDRFIDDVKLTVDTVKMLAPVIELVGIGLLAYKGYAMAATVSQWSLNAAMAANPVGVVIAALVALVAVVVIVRKNIETIKLVSMQTWNKVVTYEENAINSMIGGMNWLINSISYINQNIKYSFFSMWDSVVQKTQESIQDFIDPLNKLLEFAGKETVKINFSSAVKGMAKPVMEDTQYIKEIEVKKFSDDSIMSQIDKAKEEKQKNELEKANKATEALALAVADNTAATETNTSALKSSSSDMTGETNS